MTDHLPLWNIRKLEPPPFCTVPCSKEHVPKDEIIFAKKILKKTIHNLADTSFEDDERRVLDQIIDRSRNNLRGQKILLSLKRVQKCLQLFRDMSLLKTLTLCLDDVSSIELSSSGLSAVHLPVRGVVEYILTRIVGSVALLGRTISYCVFGYIQAHQRLAIGAFIPLNLVLSGLLSRIRALSLNKIEKLTSCYRVLYNLRKKLLPGNVQWLPSDQELPTNLEQWLAEQGFTLSMGQEESDRKSKSVDKLNDMLSRYRGNSQEVVELCTIDVDETSREEVVVIDLTDVKQEVEEKEVKEEEVEDNFVLDRRGNSQDNMDLGEPLIRESIQHVKQEPPNFQHDLGEPISRECFVVDRKGIIDPIKDGDGHSSGDSCCNDSMDITQAIDAFKKCKKATDFLMVIKKSQLKLKAKSVGVKGVKKLKYRINQLEGFHSKNERKKEVKVVRNMAIELCSRIKDCGSLTETAINDDEILVLESDNILDIKTQDVNEHFEYHLKTRKHLISLSKELAKCGRVFYYQGQKYKLSKKNTQNLTKILDMTLELLQKKQGNKKQLLSQVTSQIGGLFEKNISRLSKSSSPEMKNVRRVEKTAPTCETKTKSAQQLQNKSDILDFVESCATSLPKIVFMNLKHSVGMVFRKKMNQSKKIEIAKNYVIKALKGK